MTTVILSGRSVLYFCLSAIQLIFILLSALDLALDKYRQEDKIPAVRDTVPDDERSTDSGVCEGGKRDKKWDMGTHKTCLR
ncbi:MAG: hypothetical protein MZV63_36080 [Marinilabiliales bacterium]|nr:hypothetical protein [Marinilabiliales bacterium]